MTATLRVGAGCELTADAHAGIISALTGTSECTAYENQNDLDFITERNGNVLNKTIILPWKKEVSGRAASATVFHVDSGIVCHQGRTIDIDSSGDDFTIPVGTQGVYYIGYKITVSGGSETISKFVQKTKPRNTNFLASGSTVAYATLYSVNVDNLSITGSTRIADVYVDTERNLNKMNGFFGNVEGMYHKRTTIRGDGSNYYTLLTWEDAGELFGVNPDESNLYFSIFAMNTNAASGAVATGVSTSVQRRRWWVYFDRNIDSSVSVTVDYIIFVSRGK